MQGCRASCSNSAWYIQPREQVLKLDARGGLEMTLGEERVPGQSGGHLCEPTDVRGLPHLADFDQLWQKFVSACQT